MKYSNPLVAPDLVCDLQRNFGTKTVRFLGKLTKLNPVLVLWIIKTLTRSDKSAVIARTWRSNWNGEFDWQDFNYWIGQTHNYSRKTREALNFFKTWY